MLRSCVKPNRFRIQYASDLHLERFNVTQQPAYETLLKPVAPYLALAGDIGQPQHLEPLFQWAQDKWERIFFVAGNHDYYTRDTVTTQTIADRHEELCLLAAKFINIHYLHGEATSYFCEKENVAVVGSTLWSKVSDTAAKKNRMADYQQIITPNGEDVGNYLNGQHIRDRMALNDAILYWRDYGADVCALTHHLPSFQLIHPRYTQSDLVDCFASASDVLIRPPVRLWIFGHSHTCSNIPVNGIMCVSNARGYEGRQVPGWQPDSWMEFATSDPQEAEADAKKKYTPLRTDDSGGELF